MKQRNSGCSLSSLSCFNVSNIKVFLTLIHDFLSRKKHSRASSSFVMALEAQVQNHKVITNQLSQISNHKSVITNQ